MLAVARIAGIAGAKRVPDLAPLARTIGVHGASVDLSLEGDRGDGADRGPDGREMGALRAVAIAALAVVDMVKGVDCSAEIADCKIVRKSGGRSGDWRRPGYEPANGWGGRGAGFVRAGSGRLRA